jgi:hypothetical protein
VAQQVVNKKTPKAKAVNDIMSVYRVTKSTATDILAEAMQGVEDTRPTLWEKFMGRDEGAAVEEVDDAGATPETLADQARDFD